MTSRNDFKRLVRARMERTGERYTTARAAVLRRGPGRAAARPRPTPAPHDFAPSVPAAVSPPEMSDAAVKARTGCDWGRWVRALDKEKAHEWTHREIARHVAEKYKLNSWWSQTVTVGYERIKGLRAVGQVRGGDFRMSKSRTIAAPAARLYRLVRDARSRRRWLPDLTLEMRSVTPGTMIRTRLSSGVRIEFTFMPKGAGKCQVVVEEHGLANRDAVLERKEYWSMRLGELV